MARFTQMAEGGKGYVAEAGSVQAGENGWQGQAVDRLAAFEDMREALAQRIADIPAELSQLRAQGREKSVRFRELTGEKMMAMAWMDKIKDF